MQFIAMMLLNLQPIDTAATLRHRGATHLTRLESAAVVLVLLGSPRIRAYVAVVHPTTAAHRPERTAKRIPPSSS